MLDHSRHHHREPDATVLRRIRGISIANGLIGVAEIAAGIATNSSTLTMAGVHDGTDSALYGIKYKAAHEQDPQRKRRLREIGATSLIAVALAAGGYEIVHSALDDEPPSSAAVGVAFVGAGANLVAAGAMHKKRNHEDGHDSWKHVAFVDVPGSIVTLAVTPLSVKYPELDVAGAAIHMGLAVAIGTSILRSVHTTVEPEPTTDTIL